MLKVLDDIPAVSAQRVDGAARIGFGPDGLTELYQRAPCRVLFPQVGHARRDEAVLITTSGGLTGGDRTRLDITVMPGAVGTATTQAAEKLYRVRAEDAAVEIGTTINIGPGGACEWLAQEAILFEGAQLHRTLDVHLSKSARFLGLEMLVFGRSAMGETFATGSVMDSIAIHHDGRIQWLDRLVHHAADGRASAFTFAGSNAVATLVYCGPDAADHLDGARQLLQDKDMGGATVLGDILVLRLMHEDPAQLRGQAMDIAGWLRAMTLGKPERLPQVWYC